MAHDDDDDDNNWTLQSNTFADIQQKNRPKKFRQQRSIF